MDGKPPFDPNQPFTPAVAEKPPFDPSKPFEAAPAVDAPAQAQDAREAAATRVRGNRPVPGRQADPSWSDVGNVVTQAATGANEGLSSTVLRAADAIPYFASKAMGGEGVHPLEGTFNDTFVKPVPEPSTDAQRIGRAGGNMLGANLENIVPVAGLAGSGVRSGVTMAEQAIPGAKGVWNGIKGGTNSVLDWMAAHPGKAFASDNLGAAQAGAGGEFGKETAQDMGAGPAGQHSAEIAGQMFAPAAMATYSKVGPGALAARGTSRVAKTALENVPEGMLPEKLRPAGGTLAERGADGLAYSNREGKYVDPAEPAPKEPNFIQRNMDAGTKARTDKAVETVGSEFKKITSEPEAAANLAETNRLKTEIPGFEPGVARATNDPALLNKQKEFEGAATGDELRQRQAATDKSRGAVREYMDNTVPPVGEHPQDAVSTAAGARVDRVSGRIGQQAEDVRSQIRARSDALPEVDPTVTGNVLRDTRKSLKGEADAHMGGLRKAIDPDGTARVEISPATKDAEAVTVSVNQALDRRAQLNQDLADHYSATNRDAAANRDIRRLQAQKEQLDAAIEASGEAGTPGLAEYNRYYREEYAPKFLQGASRDVGRFNRNGYDGNKVAAEDVPTKMLGPNSISEARQVNKLYGDDPVVKQQIIDHHLDDLRRTAVDPNTGQIKEGAVNKYLAKNERLFNEMPWVREAIEAQNPDQLYQRLGQLEGRQRAVADTKVAGLSSKNPEQTIAAAVGDHTVMRGLKASVRGDPQAEAALARAVWEHVGAAAGEKSLVNPDALEKMLLPEAKGGNRRALAEVLTPQHLNRLDNVIKASRIEQRLPRPTGSAEQTDNAFSAAERAAGTSIPSAGATVSALARGRSSPVYEVPRLVMNFYRGMTQREANAVWKEALYKPDVLAKVELAAKGGKATPIQLSRMHNYLATVSEEDEKKSVSDKR